MTAPFGLVCFGVVLHLAILVLVVGFFYLVWAMYLWILLG